MHASHPRAVLFDFFGTLVAYSPSRVEQGYHATHALLADAGVTLGYEAFLERWGAVFATLDDWSRRTGREFSMQQVAVEFLAEVCPDPYPPELPERLWRAYVAEWGTAIRYLAGVPALLADLSAWARVGVITNTHATALVQEHLNRSGIAPYVEVLVTSVDHGRPKPHPSIFFAALDRLGCEASSALYVGDSFEADYLGATRAGLSALLIDPSAAAPVPAADRIASVLDVRARLLPRG